MAVTLTLEEYQALIGMSRKGMTTPDEQRVLDNFLKLIEKNNGITRYFLKVRYQETESPLPPTTRFPEVWPPELEFNIERTDRPIAKDDVLKVLDTQANKPVNVVVTRDVGGIVGWTKLEDFFLV